MSGIEIIGVVLGAIPLFIAAAEHTKGTIKIIGLARHMPDRLKEFTDDLKFQRFILEKLLESLLREAGAGDLDPANVNWTDPIIQQRLSGRLENDALEHLIVILDRSARTFQEQVNKHFAASAVSSRRLRLRGHTSQPPDLRELVEQSKKHNFTLWEKMKFVWNAEERNEMLRTMEKCNDNLRHLLELRRKEPVRHVEVFDWFERRVAGQALDLDHLETFGVNARNVHDTLTRYSNCACAEDHSHYQALLNLWPYSKHRERMDGLILKRSPEISLHGYITLDQTCAYSMRVGFWETTEEITATPIENLHSITDGSAESCVDLGIWHEKLFVTQENFPLPVNPPVKTPRIGSLREFLDGSPMQGAAFRRQNRNLADRLALATLGLHGSQWLTESWTTQSIKFVRTEDEWDRHSARCQLLDPHVLTTLGSTVEMQNDEDYDGIVAARILDSGHAVKSVLALGLALLELLLGLQIRSLCLQNPETDIKHLAQDFLDRRQQDLDDDKVLEAIGWCLTLLPPAPDRQRGLHLPKFRQHFYVEVLFPLNEYRKSRM